MANTFTPTVSGTFGGEMIWRMSSYSIPDTIVKYIDSVEYVHRSRYINKRTGFETTKHTIHSTSDTDTLIDINITFVGNLTRQWMQALTQLAKGVNGAGMEITFRDDFWTDYNYQCRWVNAGNIIENSELICGAGMLLESWERSLL